MAKNIIINKVKLLTPRGEVITIFDGGPKWALTRAITWYRFGDLNRG